MDKSSREPSGYGTHRHQDATGAQGAGTERRRYRTARGEDPERTGVNAGSPFHLRGACLAGILRQRGREPRRSRALRYQCCRCTNRSLIRHRRVMGNFMIWVVPSNLKLIDRSTRYIQRLTGLDYRAANRLLFEVIEYVEPRMKADQAYPPVVGVSVMRARHQLDNPQAEKRLMTEL